MLTPHLTRAEKAARILESGLVHQAHPDSLEFYVESESNPDTVYTVDLQAHVCTCPDFARRQATCKHQMAAQLALDILNRPPAPVVVIVQPSAPKWAQLDALLATLAPKPQAV
jgi:uncharacterized Zn finger protein